MACDDESDAFSDSFGELSEVTSDDASSNASTEAVLESGLRNRRKKQLRETESGLRQEEEKVTGNDVSSLNPGENGLKEQEEEAEETTESDLKAGDNELASGCTEIVPDEEEHVNSEVFERCADILSEEDEIESLDRSETSDSPESPSRKAAAAAVAAEEKTPQRREVYKMPLANAGIGDSFIFWPANFIILAVAWQVKLIIHLCSGFASLLGFLYGLLLDPVQKTSEVKKQVSEQLNSQLKPVVTELTPRVTGFAKRFGWGLLAVTYVLLVLGLLLIPVLLVEYLFIAKLIEKPLDFTTPLYFDYTEAHPTATVPLSRHLGSADHHGAKQFSWYKLYGEVTLTLPESDYNQKLGMFQVTGMVFSLKDEILETSSRPCMLRYQSPPIRYARTLIYSVPVLLDVTGEYQQLRLSLIELIQRESGELVGGIRVVIQPRAGFLPGAGLPEIYSSRIRIRSELPWNKSLLHKWKRTIYVWTSTVMFVGELGLILCCFRQVLLPRKKKKKTVHRQSCPSPGLTPVRKARNSVKKRVSFQEE